MDVQSNRWGEVLRNMSDHANFIKYVKSVVE